ncbi:spore germination protein [Bacillus sp. S/N-304-OC-R1]|uniref:spore germination protein n=1 Tax=Bacillus sp. S/N-304-OC-R1 TaxID=2758034 RepID=UPI001C8DD5FB|nr:spore germination protein [Bacillus sp. S/N-304-OC-R1]MBY0121076.1 spore germination protein [Bacillus sp. S/N-304-OC-R1]
MPAIIGPVQILNVGGGVVHFGDSLYLSPKSTAKSFAGQGSLSTGGLVIANNGLSATNTVDTNLIDQPIAGNN